MIGKILVNSDSMPLEQKFLNILPKSMQDTTFLMRINGLILGWVFKEIKKRDENLYDGYGLVGDYYCEYFHALRKENFQTLIEEHIQLSSNFNIKDQKSVSRLASGLLKILRSDRQVNDALIIMVMDLAIEMRQYVVEKLHLFDLNEFPKKTLNYELI